jgi:hypothetical protein
MISVSDVANYFFSYKPHKASYTMSSKSCMNYFIKNAYPIPSRIRRYKINPREIKDEITLGHSTINEVLTIDLMYNITFTGIKNVKKISLDINGNSMCSIDVINEEHTIPYFTRECPLLNSYIARNFNLVYIGIVPIDQTKPFILNMQFNYKSISHTNILMGPYYHPDSNINNAYLYIDGTMIKRKDYSKSGDYEQLNE